MSDKTTSSPDSIALPVGQKKYTKNLNDWLRKHSPETRLYRPNNRKIPPQSCSNIEHDSEDQQDQ